MQPIEIYTSAFCGYCHAAKRLLKKKGASFTEIDVGVSPSKRAEMTKRSSGGRTVPQIFIGNTHVGGCDELHALENAGRLDLLLKAS